jgi:KDO2-lipid IV(A) lauroyltransferase
MLRSRSRFGARPLPIASVGRHVLRPSADLRLIAMVADQSGPRGGCWTDFLGRPASFHRGPGKLARRLQLPMLYLACHRSRRGHYEVSFQSLGDPPYRDSADALIERYVRAAEASIRQQPETYLWTNRRWKKRPPTPPPEAAPQLS